MAQLEGFRVQNYRSLRDVTIGRLYEPREGDKLTPLTAVIGKNGVGKSALFDAFGFIADCLTLDVETACDLKQRGGFERLRTAGRKGTAFFARWRPGDIYGPKSRRRHGFPRVRPLCR